MANVLDVAQYLLEMHGPMTTMKLQKLVYYCQAWSLVWDEKPIFNENIEAWASGPVVRRLYKIHKGQYLISKIAEGNSANLIPSEKETVEVILGAYGDKDAHWLSDLTHMEKPWLNARKGAEPGENCDNVITKAALLEYYSSLSPDGEPI